MGGGAADARITLPRPMSRGLITSEGEFPRSGVFIFRLNHLISLTLQLWCTSPHAVLTRPSEHTRVLWPEWSFSPFCAQPAQGTACSGDSLPGLSGNILAPENVEQRQYRAKI